MRRLPAVLLLSLLPSAVLAQGVARSVPDSVFQRAQRLVTGGNGADGRAIVDSVLRAVPPGSADHAEALYWRAALAETAADAERAYLQLTIEYPLSPRTDAALFRLGQLELTRGNEQVARGRFERIATEFPESPLVGRAHLALARLHLEARRVPQACQAVGAGQAVAPATDVELVNQLAYLERQCRAAGAATVAAAPATGANAASSASPSRPAAPARDTARRAEPASRDAAPAERAATRTPPAAPVPPARRDTARAATPAPAPATRPTPAAPSPAARDARPEARPSSTPGFSVQVAAFDRAQPAAALAAELKAGGWDARVDADAQWHRVRVGRYATRAEAAALARRLAAQGVTGFVTGVGGR